MNVSSPTGPSAAAPDEAIYDRSFWLAYAANLMLVCANSLTFRFAEFVASLGETEEVAGEIVRAGGAVICAAISPYRSTRNEARKMVGDNFITVYMDTPVEVCEERDVKGLYAKARQAMDDGKPMGFTGVDDPYEPPIDPEITLKGYGATPEENARIIIQYLSGQGYLNHH